MTSSFDGIALPSSETSPVEGTFYSPSLSYTHEEIKSIIIVKDIEHDEDPLAGLTQPADSEENIKKDFAENATVHDNSQIHDHVHHDD